MEAKSSRMTAISVLQCVERGQFTLDEDVTRLLPELKEREILQGFEEDSGKPILVTNTKPITLRFDHRPVHEWHLKLRFRKASFNTSKRIRL